MFLVQVLPSSRINCQKNNDSLKSPSFKLPAFMRKGYLSIQDSTKQARSYHYITTAPNCHNVHTISQPTQRLSIHIPRPRKPLRPPPLRPPSHLSPPPSLLFPETPRQRMWSSSRTSELLASIGNGAERPKIIATDNPPPTIQFVRELVERKG